MNTRVSLLSLFLILSVATAFHVQPRPNSYVSSKGISKGSMTSSPCSIKKTKPSPIAPSLLLPALALMVPSPVLAAGPDWGIFEGRTGSLLHPITMASMLLLSLSTGWKGLMWRRQRELGTEISALKKQIPAVPDGEDMPASSLTIQKQIDELTATRKELVSQDNRQKHYESGVLLAAIGTAFAIEGPLNTYARAGKLFPGPHLYAGAGLVVLWAAAAACVPSMQKGSDTARSLHIGLNGVGVGLFGWQVVSGWPILMKVIEKTSWP